MEFLECRLPFCLLVFSGLEYSTGTLSRLSAIRQKLSVFNKPLVIFSKVDWHGYDKYNGKNKGLKQLAVLKITSYQQVYLS